MATFRSQVATIPNLVTLVRLFAIPVFVWLLFVAKDRLAAACLLGALGTTDWLDGYLARRLDQKSAFGAVFDPVVDRLMFFVAVPSILVDGSAPLGVLAIVLLREASVAAIAVVTFIAHRRTMVVTFAGKTGAFFMMISLPLFMASVADFTFARGAEILAWVCFIPGVITGYWSIWEYVAGLTKNNLSH